MMEMTDVNESKSSIISIRNAYKSYDGHEFILKGINMEVHHRKIYCLLGASGCGKSTLLKLIVGLMDLDSGIIETNVKSRDDLGYMTQETSLYEQLNIPETFYYYGTIYGLSKEAIKKETDKYRNFLELPDSNLCVQLLSGGQRRRVSLGVALLSNSKLLILDEPTVGVDSLLRQSIWDYLNKLCKIEQKTVIITTHYIEEGQQAHTVGFMRHGKLLCEDTPEQLIETYNAKNLEDVFISLSKEQNSITDLDEITDIQASSEKNKYPLRLKTSSKLHGYKILAEVIKNWIYLKRNLPVAAITIILPAFAMSIFAFTVGRDPVGLPLGVMSDEIPLGISYCNNVTRSENCNTEYLSCIYIDKLRDRMLDLIEYSEVDAGIEDVKSNKIWGLMYFPQNYSKAVYTIIDDILTNDSWVFDNRAYLYMDYSNSIIGTLLLRYIRDSYSDMLKEVYHNCSWPIEAASLPMKIRDPIYGDAEPDFKRYFASSGVTVLLLCTPLLYGLVIMTEEKTTGATARSIIAGVTYFEVMISHFILQIFLQIIQTLMVLIVVYGILRFPFNQPYLTTLLLGLQSFTGIAMAFTIALLSDSVAASSSFLIGFTVIVMFFGGMMWPIEGITMSIRFLSWLLPVTFPIESVRSLTVKDRGLTDMVVYKGFMSTLTWFFALLLFIFIYVKKTKGKSILKF